MQLLKLKLRSMAGKFREHGYNRGPVLKHAARMLIFMNSMSLFNRKLIFFLAGLLPSLLYAQETVPATGANASGSGGTASYTLGQLFFHSFSTPAGQLDEGVQQPYEIIRVSRHHTPSNPDADYRIFPNPATDHLLLICPLHEERTVTARVTDIHGRILKLFIIRSTRTRIDMTPFSPGIYFLLLEENRYSPTTFKIIKN